MKHYAPNLSLNIFYFQNCTLQHINNTITQRNRIGTKAYSLYSSSPSADSREAVVSYWRKYVHEVLVNRLGDLSQPRKSWLG